MCVCASGPCVRPLVSVCVSSTDTQEVTVGAGLEKGGRDWGGVDDCGVCVWGEMCHTTWYFSHRMCVCVSVSVCAVGREMVCACNRERERFVCER